MAGEKPPPLFCTVFNLHGYRGPVVTLFRFSHLIMPVLLSMVYRSESACVISRRHSVSPYGSRLLLHGAIPAGYARFRRHDIRPPPSGMEMGRALSPINVANRIDASVLSHDRLFRQFVVDMYRVIERVIPDINLISVGLLELPYGMDQRLGLLAGLPDKPGTQAPIVPIL